MNIYYIIYQTINLINHKIYVGQHVTTNINDDYLGSGDLLRLAVAKYGKQSFKKEILFVFNNEDEMNQKEREIVNEAFIARSDTYNILLGGKGGWRHIHSLAGKVKQQETMIHRYGVTHIFNDPVCRTNNSIRVKENHKNNKYKYIHELPNFDEVRLKGCVAAQSEQAKIKRNDSFSSINHQQGSTNSQFGTRWIHNIELQISKKIKKSDTLPNGWAEGRKLKF